MSLNLQSYWEIHTNTQLKTCVDWSRRRKSQCCPYLKCWYFGLWNFFYVNFDFQKYLHQKNLSIVSFLNLVPRFSPSAMLGWTFLYLCNSCPSLVEGCSGTRVQRMSSSCQHQLQLSSNNHCAEAWLTLLSQKPVVWGLFLKLCSGHPVTHEHVHYPALSDVLSRSFLFSLEKVWYFVLSRVTAPAGWMAEDTVALPNLLGGW